MEFTIDQLIALADKIGGDVKDKILAFVEAQKAAGHSTVALTEFVKALGHSVSSIIPHLGDAAKALGIVQIGAAEAAEKLLGGFSSASVAGKGLSAEVMGLGLTLEPLFMNILPRGTKMFGELGSAGVNAGAQISDTFEALQPLIGAVFGDYAPAITALGNMADGSRNLESNLIGTAAAAGDLDSFMLSLRGDIENLSDATTTFSQYTYDAAQATGSTVSQASSYAAALAKIPGALRENITIQGGSIGSMNMLTASMTLATSFGMNYTDMVSKLNEMYRKFNVTGQSSLEIIAQMASTAQTLKLPMELVSQTITSMAEKFMMFGNNAQSAVRIMQTFGQAFRDSGLSPEGIAKLMGSMTSGLERMDIGTKAFVSGASGGRGGLGGALELDLAMQRGDMAGVMGKAMEAMRREVGGQIVTLEEAVRTPALAGQMMKQVKFLQDVLHMAGSDAEAYRILDAMKKGAPAEMGKPVEAQAALRSATERGVSIQERHTDILRQSANYLQHISGLQQIQLDEWRRELFGNRGAAGSSIRERIATGRAGRTAGMGVGIPGTGREQMLTLGEGIEGSTDIGPGIHRLFSDVGTAAKAKIESGRRRLFEMTPAATAGTALAPAEFAAPTTPGRALAPARETAPTEMAAPTTGPHRAGTTAEPMKELTIHFKLTEELARYIRVLNNKGGDISSLVLNGYPDH